MTDLEEDNEVLHSHYRQHRRDYNRAYLKIKK